MTSKDRIVPKIDIRILTLLLTGEYRPREINRELGISKASFTKSSNTLLKEGLVSKRMVSNGTYPPPVYYSITEKGRRYLEENKEAIINSLVEKILECYQIIAILDDQEAEKVLERLKNHARRKN